MSDLHGGVCLSGPPFRAEHIGSLLRPKDILEGKAPDRFIAEAIRWQESLGLQVVTDGEFRRESWRLGFVRKVEGFVRADAIGDVDLQRDDAGNVARIGAAPLAAGKVRRKACVDPAVYPDLEEFFADVVDVYVQELRALHAVGGHYVQIDEVAQPLLCDENLRVAVRARGDDPDRLIDLYIGLINRIVRRRPAGMTIGVHMCRGNAMGKWMASGSYERIAERTFSTLEADAFFLEYDTERAGGFEPLRFMPRGKKVILGLVSTKTPLLESKDFLRRRIDQAALHFPLENLALSPQCGFASHSRGSALSFGQQEAKLRLVIETAREVWGAA